VYIASISQNRNESAVAKDAVIASKKAHDCIALVFDQVLDQADRSNSGNCVPYFLPFPTSTDISPQYNHLKARKYHQSLLDIDENGRQSFLRKSLNSSNATDDL